MGRLHAFSSSLLYHVDFQASLFLKMYKRQQETARSGNRIYPPIASQIKYNQDPVAKPNLFLDFYQDLFLLA